MQICTSLQTDSHASTPPHSFYRLSCRAASNVKAVKACGLSTFVRVSIYIVILFSLASTVRQTEHSVRNNVVGRLKFRHTQARAELVWEPPPRPDLAEGETRRGYLQWLKCLGTQGNGVPSPLIIGKQRSCTSKFVNMYRNGSRNATGTVVYDQISTSVQNN